MEIVHKLYKFQIVEQQSKFWREKILRISHLIIMIT